MKKEFASKDLTIPERYRFSVQSIVPRAIGLISTISKDGIHNLAPYSSFTIGTQEPHTVSFLTGTYKKHTPDKMKDTLQNIIETREFVANIVSKNIAEKMHRTAGEFLPEEDEFKECGLTPAAAKMVAPPLVAESPINIECTVLELVTIGGGKPGGGTFVIGEIQYIHAEESLYDSDGNISFTALEPVGRIGGGRFDNGGYCTVRPEDFFRFTNNKSS